MKTLPNFHVPKNLFKIADFVFISFNLQVPENSQFRVILQYRCTIMTERQELFYKSKDRPG